MRLVDEELGAYASPAVVGAIVNHALLAAGLDAIPSEPEAFARFARGQLVATAAGRLGGDVADAMLARIAPYLPPERAAAPSPAAGPGGATAARRSVRPPIRELREDSTLPRAVLGARRHPADPPGRSGDVDAHARPTARVEDPEEISSVVPVQTFRPPVAVQRAVYVVTADTRRGTDLLAALAEVGISAKRSPGVPPAGADALVLDVQSVPPPVAASWVRRAASAGVTAVVWGDPTDADTELVEACGADMTAREVALYCLSAFM
jgi:hypothetical protein